MVIIKVLEISNLTKKIGKRKILNNINVDIHKGEIVGLVGPNGAGKTTLIKTIVGLYKPTKGQILLEGIDVNHNFETAMQKVGVIMETPDMYKSLSGYKNLKLFLMLNGIKDDKRIKNVTKIVKLENRIQDKVKTYSLGMRQRLGIAQAMIKEPILLLLDEPINGLDPNGIKDLREIIKYLNEKFKMTILISSHILKELEEIATRIIMIDEGTIVEDVSMKDLKEKNRTLETEFMIRSFSSKNQIN